MEKKIDKKTESKKKYNEDKTFVQISKETHTLLKRYCKMNNIKVKDAVEEAINKAIEYNRTQ